MRKIELKTSDHPQIVKDLTKDLTNKINDVLRRNIENYLIATEQPETVESVAVSAAFSVAINAIREIAVANDLSEGEALALFDACAAHSRFQLEACVDF